MRKIIILTIASFFIFSITTFAQVKQVEVKKEVKKLSNIKGTVLDKLANENLIGAMVIIKGTNNGGISDIDGKFQIKGLEIGKEAVIEVSYVGYITKEIRITPLKDTMTVAPILLDSDDIAIKNVVVRVPVAVVKGDTTVFNAGAFKTNPDATAGDLLAKMPGFETNDEGKIEAQGEAIQRIFVDGKEFFKNDLQTALDNIPAGLIENIELFDDKSDKSKFTGYDDGTKVKTINITTKNKLGDKGATLIQASAGYGHKDIYMGNINYQHFSDNYNLSVMGGLNNINISPLGHSRRYGNSGGGINEQQGIGVNFSKIFENKNRIGVSYTYNRSDKNTINSSTSNYFPTNDFELQTYESNSTTNSISNSHNFSFDYELNIGDKTRITFRPGGSFSDGRNNSISDNYRIIDQDTTANNRNNKSTSSSYNLNGSLNIMHNFTKNSYLSLGINGSLGKNNSDSYLDGETIYSFEIDSRPKETQHQKSDNLSNTDRLSADIDYTYRISRASGLSFSYEFSQNNNNSDRRTYEFDELTGQYLDERDPIFSNELNNNYITNNAGARYNYRTELVSFGVTAKYQNAITTNTQIFPFSKIIDHTFNGAVINADFSYKKREDGGGLNISYGGNPSYPSVNDLQEVLDNDNPLQLSSGNPNLKQSYNNNIRLSYRFANVEESTFFNVYSSFSNTINGVVNNTVLYREDDTITIGDQVYDVTKGAQYTSPINMNGSWRGGVGVNFSFPFSLIRSKMNLGGSYDYTKRPSMYNNVEYSTASNGGSLRASISSNISENIDFTIRNRARYQVSNNSRLQVGDNDGKSTSFTNNLNFSLNVIVWNGFFFNTSYEMTYRDYSTQPVDEPFTNSLNFAVGKKFKSNRYEIRASVYDALNQNISISQRVNDLSVTKSVSNNITRYVALTLSYNFNNMQNELAKLRRDAGGRGQKDIKDKKKKGGGNHRRMGLSRSGGSITL